MIFAAPHRRSLSLSTQLLIFLLVGLLSVACNDGDLRGTYRVEIDLDRSRAPIDAILVLTSTQLDTDSLPYEARHGYSEDSSTDGDYAENQAGPNSCLILPSGDPDDDAPRSVSFFETRIRGGEAIVPFSIFKTQDQRMEVVDLQFFANALGGEISFHEADGERSGRLIGDRLSGPRGSQCIEAMRKFHARIEELTGSR